MIDLTEKFARDVAVLPSNVRHVVDLEASDPFVGFDAPNVQARLDDRHGDQAQDAAGEGRRCVVVRPGEAEVGALPTDQGQVLGSQCALGLERFRRSERRAGPSDRFGCRR